MCPDGTNWGFEMFFSLGGGGKGEENQSNCRKTLRSEQGGEPTPNSTQIIILSMPEIEPEPPWWKASALTTEAISLKRLQVKINAHTLEASMCLYLFTPHSIECLEYRYYLLDQGSQNHDLAKWQSYIP